MGGASASKLVSGGLCGFDVAADLVQIDFSVAPDDEGSSSSSFSFSSPSSSVNAMNSEFRALAFDETTPPQQAQKNKKQSTLRSLRSDAAELQQELLVPAGDPKLGSFLKQLEEQQRLILRMLLAERKEEASLVLLKAPLERLAAAGITEKVDVEEERS